MDGRVVAHIHWRKELYGRKHYESWHRGTCLITAILIMIITQHAIKYALSHDVYEYGGAKMSVQKVEEESDSVSLSIIHDKGILMGIL